MSRTPANVRRNIGDHVVPLLAAPSYVVESTELNFGPVEPGTEREIRDAIVVRVTSAEPWVLKLIAHRTCADASADCAPVSRLAWSASGVSYVPFVDSRPAIVASGGATGPAGTEVRIALRLLFGDDDPVGSVITRIGIEVENR